MTFPARIKATFRLLMARTSFALLASLLPLLLWAQSPISADDAVLQRIDELSNLPWLKNDPFVADRNALNVNGFAPSDTPRYTPEVYRQRLAILDERTPFKLTYNEPVQAYLDLYTQRKREQTGRMLGLAQLYFPVFEEALDRHGLPHELKYLAVVESALFPGARSRAAAVGLWQFMVGTGKMYGLHVDSYMDERCDVYASTDAACRYLKDLHRIFGNWELALAAYNCGPGNVNKAVRRAGGTLDYWAVYNHLPRETRGYVPAFIAVNYVFAHAADHNLYPATPMFCGHQMDTVQVCYPLDLAGVARMTGSNEKELLDLNPTFKLGVVPDVDQPVTLYLPKRTAGVFVSNEDSLKYAFFRTTPALPPTIEDRPAATASAPRYHTVRRGESLGVIANKYRLSVTELKRLNNLRGTTIHAGQKLKVGHTTTTVAARATPCVRARRRVPALPRPSGRARRGRPARR